MANFLLCSSGKTFLQQSSWRLFNPVSLSQKTIGSATSKSDMSLFNTVWRWLIFRLMGKFSCYIMIKIVFRRSWKFWANILTISFLNQPADVVCKFFMFWKIFFRFLTILKDRLLIFDIFVVFVIVDSIFLTGVFLSFKLLYNVEAQKHKSFILVQSVANLIKNVRTKVNRNEDILNVIRYSIKTSIFSRFSCAGSRK